MEQLNNPYIIAPLTALVSVQIIKFAIHAFREERDWKYLIRTGGMPSAHIAVVYALAASAVGVDGFKSAAFGITAVFAGITTYNTLSLSQQLLKHTHAIRGLQSSGKQRTELLKLEYIDERTWRQVLAGALLGVELGFIVTITYWIDNFSWLTARLSQGEAIAYLLTFILILAASEAAVLFVNSKRLRKLPTSRTLKRTLRLSLSAPAALGIIFALLQYESLQSFDNRIWTTLVFIVMIAGSSWAYWKVYRKARARLAEEAEHFEREKKRKAKSTKKKSKKSQRKKKK